MRTEGFRGALLSALVIASLITPLLLLSPSPVRAALTPHAPIFIDGNDNFTSPDPVNGGGSGAENDPYIIENWVINASTAHGIEVRNTTDYFVVRNCVVENGGSSYDGIYLDNVVNGKIENCTVSSNLVGILLERSPNNVITNCTAENNRYPGYWGGWGIWLMHSSNNYLRNNTLTNNTYGFGVWSWEKISDFYQDIDTSNKINGKPIYYVIEQENLTFDGNLMDVGYLGLISCENILVKNLNMSNIHHGVLTINVSYSMVTNCVFSNTRFALNISWGSSNNIYKNCNVENSYYGISFGQSSENNIVTNCNVENSHHYGIYLDYSDNNSIYHNNFINNDNQAYDDGSNYWDDGYPSGGNYWDNYAGEDNYQGENQDIPGGDGIGDAPYYISGDSNLDRYPFMNPFPQWTGTADFSLVNLYTVNVEKILDLGQGSKLVVKFYTYGDGYENENVVENFSPPWHVEENESARHPDGVGVKKARLDLTTDNTEDVISTIASFIVTKLMLEIRFSEIPLDWALAPLEEKVALEAEFSDIPLYWALAPS